VFGHVVSDPDKDKDSAAAAAADTAEPNRLLL